MIPVATYVFLDLETTGLPQEENNRTRITELSLVAVKRHHVLDTHPGCRPRVQNKLTLCFNPGRVIPPSCTVVTGLCNELLEHETTFNKEVFTLIDTFLNLLTKPVCLIAQNGHRFDFPILKNHIQKLGVSLSNDLLCADCLHGFYDIMENKNRVPAINLNLPSNTNGNHKTDISETDFIEVDTSLIQLQNETTPKRQIIKQNDYPKYAIASVCRKFPWSEGEKPQDKYKLKDIYERLLNRPAVDAHQAENDCMLALECFVVLSEQMVKWVDEQHCLFSDIRPMTIGVPIGK